MASLAAGGAATMGTGALSSVEAERNIRGRVVGDERAYLEINGFDTTENSYAIETSDNEMLLDFDQDPDYTVFDSDDNTKDPDPTDPDTDLGNDEAEGLNPDAISRFDDVFRIQNDGTEKLDVYITDNLDRVTFYEGGDHTDSLEKSGNSVTLDPFDEAADTDDDGDPKATSDPAASEVNVGVEIDLTGKTSTGDVFNGDDKFTIIAEETA